MTLFYYYGGADLGNTAVRLGHGFAFTESAEAGTVATSSVEVDDVGGALGLVGLKPFRVDETACSWRRLFTGFVADRDIGRAESLNVGASRRWLTNVVDANAALNLQAMQNPESNRPAETDIARIRWWLSSAWSVGIIDAGYIDTSGAVNLEATDYRGRYGADLMQEAAVISGKNYFVAYDEPSNAFALHYYGSDSTLNESTIKISNVLDDVDSSTIYAPSKDAKLNRDPSRVYAGVYQNYGSGSAHVYVTNPTTASTFYPRDETNTDSTIHTAAQATAKANQLLNLGSTEFDKITVNLLNVPASRVNLLRQGQRIRVKFAHMPGYESFTWIRVNRRTVRQAGDTEALYELTLELSNTKLSGAGNAPGPGDTPPGGTNTETPTSITRFQLAHEVGAGPFGPDVLTGLLYYSVPPSFAFGALGAAFGAIVSRLPEAGVPWEYTPCGLGPDANAGLTTREAWYRFQVNLADNVTGVKITIAPFKVVDGFGTYQDSPSGDLVGTGTVRCGIHTGASATGVELTTEGQFTEVGLVGDQGGTVTIGRDQLIDAADGYNWFILAPNWTISTTLLICNPDPLPWGWGDDGGDGDSIVSIDTQAHFIGSASEVSFDPTASGLPATNVQDAIDALAAAPAPPLSEVLTSGNSTEGIAIDGAASGTFGELDLDASGGTLEFVGATRTSEVTVYDNNVEMKVLGGTEHGFYAGENAIAIRDATGSHGTTGQVLTAVGDDTAHWAATGSSSPTGSAGGDLSGSYPNPDVVDDSHNHTSSTLPAVTTPTLAEVLLAGNTVGGTFIEGDPTAGLAGALVLNGSEGSLQFVGASSTAQAVVYNDNAALTVLPGGGPSHGFFVDDVGTYIADGSASFGTTGQVLTADGTGFLPASWASLLTSAAGAPGGSFVSPLYLDTTAVTGGLYAWNGASYTKVAPPA